MRIELEKLYIGTDGEVVEIKAIEDIRVDTNILIWFRHSIKADYLHVLTDLDFLEQYKPYEPVFEYRYAIELSSGEIRITESFSTDEKAKGTLCKTRQRLDFTKRER